MCLPPNTDQTGSTPDPPIRSIVGFGALMVLACLAAPVIAGAIGAVGLGALAGAGGFVAALALCAAVPIGVAVARGARRDRQAAVWLQRRRGR